ncbi:hypothetical protein SS50377_27211 [Spironucleus salmonicida]|uniref:BPI-like protein n=1 Tax=Spironucleus salmonicida TaxID=348837 RepID=V6LXH8_9EUKA|nr:hypothetical protein SS50377_27211 [Spironucleus salmonicida]|eukprot:EST48953.1 Hypothetical protein SS50377_10798 [Spironucleus salmonicida]
MMILLGVCFYDTFDETNMSKVIPAGYAFITESGLENYMSKNQLGVLSSLAGEVLIDSLEIPILAFKINLDNLIIKDINPPSVKIVLNPMKQQGSLQFSNLSFYLSLEFSINQQTWPFLTDAGIGQISLINVELSTTLKFVASECKDMYNFLRVGQQFKIKELTMTLSGSLSYIYNSILSLLQDVLINQLNGPLGNSIVDILITSLNSQMDVWYNRAGVSGSMTISDGRWLHAPYIVDRGIYLDISFQRCQLVSNTTTGDRCIGNYSEQMLEKPNFLTNSELQTYASRTAFNAGFSLFKEQQKILTIQSDIYQINIINLTQFTNIGAKILIELQKGENIFTAIFFSNITAKEVNKKDYMFQLHFDRYIMTSENFSPLIQSSVTEILTKQFYNYQLTYTNMENYDWKTFFIIYINHDWISSNVDLLK